MEAVVHAVDQVGQVVHKVPGEGELEDGKWEEGENRRKEGPTLCAMRLFKGCKVCPI